MFSSFERMMAFRYLRARRAEGFISVIAGFSLMGIALGVATLIIVMAVMNGFRDELLGRIIGVKGHVMVQNAEGGPLPDYDSYALRVKDIPGVAAVAPIVQGQAMATHRGIATGAAVTGMRYEDVRNKKILADNIKQGRLDTFATGEGVLIGQKMAAHLQLRVGDYITLISPEGRATFAGLMPRLKAYQVAALFDVGMYEYDSALVIMPLEEAQIYFKLKEGDKDTVSGLEIQATSFENATPVAHAINNMGEGKVTANDWQKIDPHFFNAIQVERNVMFLILTLIIVVAAFNIISSLIMLVKDKGRDIAILRTMGASRGMVLRIFFACGASIGVVGTLLGMLMGLGLALNIGSIQRWLEGLTGTELFAAEIYFLSTLPARVDFTEVTAIGAMALVLSLLATIYPALRAARLDPAEALRYE